MKDLKFRLRGTSPMIVHNGQTANPLNAYAKQLKSVSKKRNKTDEDLEKLAQIEFRAGWYLGANGEYTIPAHNIEATMTAGAKRDKNGKLVQSGAFVVEDPKLVFEGSDKSVEDLWEGRKHALMVTVCVSRRRVLRTRPMVPTGWTADVTVRHDPKVLGPEVVQRALEVAGMEHGLGDWRPKFGRFLVETL